MSETSPTFSIPYSEYLRFHVMFIQGHFSSQRYGQAFYNHMNFHKVQDPAFKTWADELYQVENRDIAIAKIRAALDHTN